MRRKLVLLFAVYIAAVALTVYLPAEETSVFSDSGEVKEVFSVPVERILMETPSHYAERMTPVIDPAFPYEEIGVARDYHWTTPSNDIPVYDIDGRIIWGLTGRITENVVNTLKELL